MKKVKVLQIGIIISFLGLLVYKLVPSSSLFEISVGSISNIILFSLIFLWVTTYLLRVVNGKMTFMEQRKRYRQLYEKKFNEKLEKKFESLSNDEQKKLLEELDEK